MLKWNWIAWNTCRKYRKVEIMHNQGVKKKNEKKKKRKEMLKVKLVFE